MAQLLAYMVRRVGQHSLVELVDPDALDLNEPFFRHSVPDGSANRSIVSFNEWIGRRPAIDQDYSDVCGIFHVSRCGSTLLAKNLRDARDATVLSEPPFFRILRHRLDQTVSPSEAVHTSLAILEPWRKWARQKGTKLVIKFNSQMHMYLDELLPHMPGAKFVFLYREPRAVLESLERKPPLYLLREMAQRKYDLVPELQKIAASPLLLAGASRYCHAMANFSRHKTDAILHVPYPELEEMFPAIVDHFGLGDRLSWSGASYAKARSSHPAPDYVPISEAQLSAFADTHRELLQVAQSGFEAFETSLSNAAV